MEIAEMRESSPHDSLDLVIVDQDRLTYREIQERIFYVRTIMLAESYYYLLCYVINFIMALAFDYWSGYIWSFLDTFVPIAGFCGFYSLIGYLLKCSFWSFEPEDNSPSRYGTIMGLALSFLAIMDSLIRHGTLLLWPYLCIVACLNLVLLIVAIYAPAWMLDFFGARRYSPR